MGQIIGGVLLVNGIKGLLDNYANRCVADDPVRNGIAILAGHLFDKRVPVSKVVDEVIRLGLTDPLIPTNERRTHESQKRGLDKVLLRAKSSLCN